MLATVSRTCFGRGGMAERPGAPAIMGIVNVTPDSFSDGGLFHDPDAAAAHARKLLDEGAQIVDVGGESTRANATPVGAEEEINRVLPVISALRDVPALISIDTMKASVAEAAIGAGAVIVNDIRGLQGDPDMAHVAARHGAGMIVMHNPGLLGSAKPMDGDPVAASLAYFERSLEIARRAGIAEDRIALDPGFGFGKSLEQNLELLARLCELHRLGIPAPGGHLAQIVHRQGDRPRDAGPADRDDRHQCRGGACGSRHPARA